MNQVLVAHDRDADIIPGNIKDGIEIEGVMGNYTGAGNIGVISNSTQTTVQAVGFHSTADIHLEVVHNGTNYLFAVAMIGSWKGTYCMCAGIFAIQKSTGSANVFFTIPGIGYSPSSLDINVDDTLGKVKIEYDSGTMQYRYYDFSINDYGTSTGTYIAPDTASAVYNGKTYTQSRVERLNNDGSYTALSIT